jgi:ketosteroid isomerase-like protein
VRKALWDGVVTVKDGSRPYENTCSWLLQVQDEKIVSATAFFDTQVFDDFWTRISRVDVALRVQVCPSRSNRVSTA